MQVHYLPCNRSLDPPATDPSAMSVHYSPIHSPRNPDSKKPDVENNSKNESAVENTSVRNNNVSPSSSSVMRRERPSRACTQRTAARMQAEASMAEAGRKRKKARREKLAPRLLKEESEEEEEEEEGMEENGGSSLECSKIITQLVGDPETSQLPRWNIRSMWQLASILNFLNVFMPLLNIKVEFSAEELETALISPNNMLADIHMPLLKAIPPVARMALGHSTWITVLCQKLRNWWHWVAEGDLPIVASHGAEIEAYSALEPGVRVVILKALCDIRVEQEDIRNYIDESIKSCVQLSLFRKQRIGGDSHGISYWYEEDPIIGHRLYREIRKVEVKKGKGKSIPPIPHSSYQWETVATNLDEFQNVNEKLVSSKNRTEVSVAKKLKNDMLPEIEKVHKRKEKRLRKQHRETLMLDNMINIDAIGAGRSLRDRKPVTYTFDDYDRSISEAIKVTKYGTEQKTQPSPEPLVNLEASRNGRWSEPSQENLSFSAPSPNSPDNGEEFYDDMKNETLDRSNRRRQRPQRYMKEFVHPVSDNDAGFDSDNDIVGEVVNDDEYQKSRKKGILTSSSSEDDEEYYLDQENHEEDEDEEEEEDESLSSGQDSDGGLRFKTYRATRTRKVSKLRSDNDFHSGLRRSKRATRNHINYRQIEMSEPETEPETGPDKSNPLDERNNIIDNGELSMSGQDSEGVDNKQDVHENQVTEEHNGMVDKKQDDFHALSNNSDQEEVGVKKRRFLDLNELAPGSGLDDGPNSNRDETDDQKSFPFRKET